MSTIKVNKLESTTSGGNCVVNATNISSRNMIINGACQVNQLGTGTGITNGNLGYKGGADQWRTIPNNLGTYTVSNDSEAPDEFGNSYKLDCTTASASPAADGEMCINFRMEGNLLQGLAYGTSSAKTTTLSFWVRCTKTGNFQVNLKNNDRDRIISSVVTISSANTWEKKVITFAGDTTANQVIDNDNTNCFQIEIYLDAGSDLKGGTAPSAWEARAQTDRAAGVTLAFGDNTSNDIYFTGMQWEIGERATEFEWKSYNDQLLDCQRYLRVYGGSAAYQRVGIGYFSNTTRLECPLTLAPPMRTTPTMTVSNAGHWKAESPSGSGEFTAVGLDGNSSNQVAIIWGDKSNTFTAGESGRYLADNTTDARIYLAAGL